MSFLFRNDGGHPSPLGPAAAGATTLLIYSVLRLPVRAGVTISAAPAGKFIFY